MKTIILCYTALPENQESKSRFSGNVSLQKFFWEDWNTIIAKALLTIRKKMEEKFGEKLQDPLITKIIKL